MPSKDTPISKILLLEHGNDRLCKFLLGILSIDVQCLGEKAVPYNTVKYLIISLSRTPSDFLGVYSLAPNIITDLFLKHAILV